MQIIFLKKKKEKTIENDLILKKKHAERHNFCSFPFPLKCNIFINPFMEGKRVLDKSFLETKFEKTFDKEFINKYNQKNNLNEFVAPESYAYEKKSKLSRL